MENTDKISNEEELRVFFRNLGLVVEINVISQVVDILEGKSSKSMYELYDSGRRRDNSIRTPICGKGTTAKISKLYQQGKLNPYLAYRTMKVADVEEKISSGTYAEPTYEHEEPKQSSLELGNITQIPKSKTRQDNENYTGRFFWEWEHYEKMTEALIKLKYASIEERTTLIDIINRERAMLDDPKLQKQTDKVLAAVREATRLYMSVWPDSIDNLISFANLRMNKRYPLHSK